VTCDHRDDGPRDERRQRGCLAAGMNAYISKPVHSAHLLSIIEEFAFPQNRASSEGSVGHLERWRSVSFLCS